MVLYAGTVYPDPLQKISWAVPFMFLIAHSCFPSSPAAASKWLTESPLADHLWQSFGTRPSSVAYLCVVCYVCDV
jgi:hypothetical protein